MSQPSLPRDVMADIIERLPVKYSRQASKATMMGSPNYTQLLKQRGYTNEFLVELLDAVELIEPGLLEVLKHFYEFRKTHKKTEKLLTKDIELFKNKLNHIEDKDYYDRLYFIKIYYRYKVYSLFNLDWDKHNYTKINIAFYKDNLNELKRLLEAPKALKEDIRDYRQTFEEEDSKYYFGNPFVESLNALFNEIENHYDKIIEEYELAIRDYHARKRAKEAAEKEKAATAKLIASVNKKAATKKRVAKTAPPFV